MGVGAGSRADRAGRHAGDAAFDPHRNLAVCRTSRASVCAHLPLAAGYSARPGLRLGALAAWLVLGRRLVRCVLGGHGCDRDVGGDGDRRARGLRPVPAARRSRSADRPCAGARRGRRDHGPGKPRGAEPAGRRLRHEDRPAAALHGHVCVLADRAICRALLSAGIPGLHREHPFRALDHGAKDRRPPVPLELRRQLGKLSRGFHHQGPYRLDRRLVEHGRLPEGDEPVPGRRDRRRPLQALGAAPAGSDGILVFGLSRPDDHQHPYQRRDPARAGRGHDRG